MHDDEERYFKTYHWLIGCILAIIYGFGKFGFSWKALLTAWAVMVMFFVVAWVFVIIVDKYKDK
jgi:hypothetical protein